MNYDDSNINMISQHNLALANTDVALTYQVFTIIHYKQLDHTNIALTYRGIHEKGLGGVVSAVSVQRDRYMGYIE